MIADMGSSSIQQLTGLCSSHRDLELFRAAPLVVMSETRARKVQEICDSICTYQAGGCRDPFFEEKLWESCNSQVRKEGILCVCRLNTL